MTKGQEGDATDYANRESNFELPRHGAIREDNWAEYQARGFHHLGNTDGSDSKRIGFLQMQYGTEHVYTGDAYDEQAQRPLQHRPGIGIYSDPEGLIFADKDGKLWREWHRQMEELKSQGSSEGGPESN